MDETRDPEELGRRGLDWLLSTARETDGGLAWPVKPSDPDVDFMLYWGTPGIVMALLEGHHHFGDDRYGDAALRGAQAIAGAVPACERSSLYAGVMGMAVALRAVGERLADTDHSASVNRALELTRSRFDGERWNKMFELLLGNAGIALGAVYCGDPELAVDALEPYARSAERTPHGVQWRVRFEPPDHRMLHLSHGTLGIAYALAEVGHFANRSDFMGLALAGAADVVARNEAEPNGFLVPHSSPWLDTNQAARYNYGWCHGPTGDALAFRLLRDVTGDPVWARRADQCWHTVTHSGLPQRLRPGFWDNNGRCCGTAGVLALACDRLVEQDDDPAGGRDDADVPDGHRDVTDARGFAGVPDGRRDAADRDFADVLVGDLASQAIVDDDGARWSNVEHRADPSTLEPRTGWAMGNAGIVRELLRYVRIRDGRDPGYAVEWPDHPAVKPLRP